MCLFLVADGTYDVDAHFDITRGENIALQQSHNYKDKGCANTSLIENVWHYLYSPIKHIFTICSGLKENVINVCNENEECHIWLTFYTSKIVILLL